MQPFKIDFSEYDYKQLIDRLKQTRWPDEIHGTGWDYGIPLDYMKEIINFWVQEYDWQSVQTRINAFQQFKADVDGMDFHFVYQKGHGPNRVPILLLHGWPSTFYEMTHLLPLLTEQGHFGDEPEISFDVVVPSIPGHGFSSRPSSVAFEDRTAAHLLVKLMKQLGYSRFGIHAYDLGASISGLLCLDFPDSVIGYHTTSPGNPGPYVPEDLTELSNEEQLFVAYQKEWYREEGGYAHILGTRPQTLAYALNDSPAGLAAFILEKWYTWTAPPSSNLDDHFKKEDLITTVMIYWITQTINSANRYYYEGRHIKWPGEHDKIDTPTGVALTATQQFERPPKDYVERLFTNVKEWRELHKGGHFVTLEEPKLVADMIRKFFNKITG